MVAKTYVPTDPKYAANGRNRRAIERMKVWQQQLDEGMAFADIVKLAIAHRNDVGAKYFYQERIRDLIETGELKDPHGVLEA